MSGLRGIFTLQRRDYERDMLVQYEIHYDSDPWCRGWTVEVLSVHFTEDDTKDRSHLFTYESLQILQKRILSETIRVGEEEGTIRHGIPVRRF